MPGQSAANTIRVLVSTDNHVGYNERDAQRGDDSWKSFDEIMRLAKSQEVDMVLLAGDLFHENKPSRKSMYQVMRSLRMNCYGDQPCELEMLSDGTEVFQGAFSHVNYEDEDINVAIPVFSIHGNHDDPSGEGHLAALDLLQMSGLLNYYGRTPESDNIQIKPVLLQKGRTKLALYGMSNVRDERLFRTFRDGKVKFFQPNTQTDDWFNLMSVHQNHHAYTESGYLPETFLPSFLDLVVWGHEHECLIDPKYNPEMSFHVMQPGSSVATSLMPGEAVTKKVAILSITGKEFTCETIPLKTVRPFVMREIVLQDDSRMAKLAQKDNNRSEITRYLVDIVNEMIDEAKQSWLATQDDDDENVETEPPLPLIRLRVEYTAPQGYKFDCENPQCFSNRFVGKVANVNDVVQFHRKKASSTKKASAHAEMPEDSVMAELSIDTIKVEKLVREFLTAQSLTILPQKSFGDAVTQFVDKDDKHAMELFVGESLKNQVSHLVGSDEFDQDKINRAMEMYKEKVEQSFAAGHQKQLRRGELRPREEGYDSDIDGPWEDNMRAYEAMGGEALDAALSDGDFGTIRPKKSQATKTKAAPKAKSAAKSGRARKATTIEDDDDDDDDNDDVVMIDEPDDDMDEPESQGLFVSDKPTKAAAKSTTKRAPTTKAPPRANKPAKVSAAQTRLDFSQPAKTTTTTIGKEGRAPAQPPHDVIESDDDDDDAFAPAPTTSRTTRNRN